MVNPPRPISHVESEFPNCDSHHQSCKKIPSSSESLKLSFSMLRRKNRHCAKNLCDILQRTKENEAHSVVKFRGWMKGGNLDFYELLDAWTVAIGKRWGAGSSSLQCCVSFLADKWQWSGEFCVDNWVHRARLRKGWPRISNCFHDSRDCLKPSIQKKSHHHFLSGMDRSYQNILQLTDKESLQ